MVRNCDFTYIYNLLFKSCRVAPHCLRKTSKSTVNPPMINLHYYVGISPNLSSILWCCTSKTGCTLLVDLFFPIVVNILVSMLFALCFFCITRGALLVDLLFLIRVNTLVNGLLDILFGRACFLVFTCRVTLVFAGLVAVKCLHMGVLCDCAISLTLFILWSMTSFHLFIHFLICWLVASSRIFRVSLNILISSSGSIISRNVYMCVTFFVRES